MKEVYNKLGVTRGYFVDLLQEDLGETVAGEYTDKIVNEIADDVAGRVAETSDIEDWGRDDRRLAIGWVLCNKLGIKH